ncbi:MAG: hypothetical protein Hyperionvirus4_13 [Hyperionvirus sp.]|uniref:Leucine-rich repeat protein n=1 Tax=Hyperionvirus sp. TaxID=2487770 RepID=A0A3G5A795_9VIRU|nr:MAG: hypothetical protein Hyperionvirus4_13 [Hyperionvirus sp.]
MKLEYLSMVNNSTLTPDFKRMTLTRLNIDRGLLVRLGDELIHCTTIKHLDIREIRDGYYKSHSEKLIWPKKLTFLEELTLDLVPETNFGDYLNKLTFLEYKNSLETHCDSNPRCPSTLRTLIIKGKMPCFSDYYPVSLTHLEISDIYGQGFQWDGKSSYCDLINLTHLQLSNTPFDYLGGLDNLKTLILYTITMPKRPIDIYGLKSLKSLKISGGNFYYFENRGGLQRSESLESLTIDTHNSPMNDDLLLTFPGVKYIYLGSISCKDVTGSCFKDLPNLFFLEIPKDENNLDKGCLESLRARDIIIRYIPKAYDFNYPNT